MRFQNLFFENLLYFDIGREQKEVLFLKQPIILPLLFHKSATTCPIDSSKVSNSKLKLDLCNCVKLEVIKSTSPPQQPNKVARFFWDTLWKKKEKLAYIVFSKR